MTPTQRFSAPPPGRWRGFLRAACALAILSWVAAATAVQAPAVLTVLEGQATVVVGAQAYAAAAGARLDAGAIIETDANTKLLRLEWPDGSLLDLGPATRVMLRPPMKSGPAQPLFYLLQGWAKQTQTAEVSGQLSPAFAVPPFKGVLVTQLESTGAVLFAEVGAAQLAGRSSATLLPLRAGQAGVAGGDGNVKVLPRPPEGWLANIPRAFRDTLPPQAARFQGPPSALPQRAALTYEALQHWLVAEPELRRDFPSRFAPLLSDRAFRGAVAKQLRLHPEWRVALRPPPPRAASAPR